MLKQIISFENLLFLACLQVSAKINKRILVALIILPLIFGAWCIPSYAYIRDANIASSRDSVSLGWYCGFSISGEKTLDDKSSIGFYYLPKYEHPLNLSYNNTWDVTYNRQIAGEEDDFFASSFFIGGVGDEYSSSTNLPYLGFSFSWRLNPYPAKFRLNIIYFFPFYFEFGYKLSENIEIASALGYPFQLISLRYLF